MDKFIENLISLFDEADPKTIRPDAVLKEIEGYSSFVALSIIAMADEIYNFKLRGDDIRKANTVQDLFNIINKK